MNINRCSIQFVRIFVLGTDILYIYVRVYIYIRIYNVRFWVVSLDCVVAYGITSNTEGVLDGLKNMHHN